MSEIDEIEAAVTEESSAADESQVEALSEDAEVAGGEASLEEAAAETTGTHDADALAKTVAELQEKVSRFGPAYDRLMSEKMQAENAAKSLSARLEKLEGQLTKSGDKEFIANLQKRFDNGEITADVLVEAIDKRAEAKAREIAEPMVNQTAASMQQSWQQEQLNQRATKAWDSAKEHATSKLGLTEEQFKAFMYEPGNVDPRTGVPFGWASPEEAQKAAIERMNGRYFERASKVIPKVAAKAGAEAAAKRLTQAGTARTAPVHGGGGDLSPTEETMKMLRETEV